MKKYFSEFGESPVLDNAEPTLLDTEKAWLAGIFDGEGSLILDKSRNARLPIIGFHITNTDMTLLGKVQFIIQKMINKPIKLYPKKRYDNHIVNSQKPCYSIDLRKHSEVLKILKEIYPYLTSKSKRAELLITYLSCKIKYVIKNQSTVIPDLLIVVAQNVLDEWRGVETKREAPVKNRMKP
jgi:hypothetical protein